METKFDIGETVAIDIKAKVDRIVIEGNCTNTEPIYYLAGVNLPLTESQLAKIGESEKQDVNGIIAELTARLGETMAASSKMINP